MSRITFALLGIVLTSLVLTASIQASCGDYVFFRNAEGKLVRASDADEWPPRLHGAELPSRGVAGRVGSRSTGGPSGECSRQASLQRPELLRPLESASFTGTAPFADPSSARIDCPAPQFPWR